MLGTLYIILVVLLALAAGTYIWLQRTVLWYRIASFVWIGAMVALCLIYAPG